MIDRKGDAMKDGEDSPSEGNIFKKVLGEAWTSALVVLILGLICIVTGIVFDNNALIIAGIGAAALIGFVAYNKITGKVP